MVGIVRVEMFEPSPSSRPHVMSHAIGIEDGTARVAVVQSLYLRTTDKMSSLPRRHLPVCDQGPF